MNNAKVKFELNESVLNEDEDFDFGDDESGIDLDVATEDGSYEVLYEDDSFKLCHPNDEYGMIVLSTGTTWLGGNSRWGRSKEYSVDDNSWLLKTEAWDKQYILLDKKDARKRYRIQKGDGAIYVASGARYSGATWLATNGTLGLKKWFVKNTFPFITTNLKKKVGAEMLGSDTTTYVYPQEDGDPGYKARSKATQITKIEVKDGTKTIKDIGGFPNVTEVVIPEGVTRISRYAFYGLGKLEQVVFPSTVTQIGDYVFYNCDSLKKVFIPKSVKTIKGMLFYTYLYFSVRISVEGNWHIKRPREEILADYKEALEPIKERLTIYCEASEKPAGWANNWDDITWSHFNDLTEEEKQLFKLNVVWGATKADLGITEDLDLTEDESEFDFGDDSGIDLDAMEEPARISKLYEDDTWNVSLPKNYFGMIKLSANTNWGYDEELNKKLSDEDEPDFDPMDNFKAQRWANYNIYVFTNKKTGDVYGYSPNGWDLPGGRGGYYHKFIRGKNGDTYPSPVYRSNGAEALEYFLKAEGTDGLMLWASKKWKSGLGELKNYVEALRTMRDVDFTLEYPSELCNKMIHASGWFDEDKVYVEMKGLVKKIIVKEGTTDIENGAFSNHYSSLSEVEFPDSLKTIRKYAFYDCSQLKSLSLPPHLERIEDQAFEYCKAKSVVLPESVKYLGRDAFAYSNVKQIYIPDGCEVHVNSFGSCLELKTIYYGGNELSPSLTDAVNKLKSCAESHYSHYAFKDNGEVKLNAKPSDMPILEDLDPSIELEPSDIPNYKSGQKEFVDSIRKEAEKYGARLDKYRGLYPLRKDEVWDNYYSLILNDEWGVEVYSSGDLEVWPKGSQNDDDCIYDDRGLEENGIITDDDVYAEIGFDDEKPYQYSEYNYRYVQFCIFKLNGSIEYYGADEGYDDAESIDEYSVTELITEIVPEVLRGHGHEFVVPLPKEEE